MEVAINKMSLFLVQVILPRDRLKFVKIEVMHYFKPANETVRVL